MTWLLLCDITLGLAILISSWRLVRGPALPDRVVALDLMTTFIVGFACLRSIASGNWVFFDLALAIGLVGFIGTIAFSVFIERRQQEALAADAPAEVEEAT